MLKALFAGSRFVVALAVLGAFVGSVVLLVSATLTVFRLAWEVVVDLRDTFTALPGGDSQMLTTRHIEHLGVQFIQLTDIVLLGTVMYLVSIGLYQLFIDQHLPLPQWLRVSDLMELKRDLIGVTVVLLGVTFLGTVVEWNLGDPGEDILQIGAGIALVMAALGLILWLSPELPDRSETEPEAASSESRKPHPGPS